jgi:hypothetical protein
MIAMRKPGLVSCVNGTTAVEFAMVLPPFLMLLLGIMYGSLAIYTAASLHYAVEGAARCYSFMPACAGSATTTQSYAKSLYLGPGSPTFTASTGHQVNATLKNVVPGTYVAPLNVTLSATACFP